MVNPSWDSGGSYTQIGGDEFTSTTLSSMWQPGWFGASGVTPGVNSGSPQNNSANVTLPGDGTLHLTLTSSYGGLVSSNPNNSATSTGFEFSPPAAIEIRANLPQNGTDVANWCALWTDGQNWPNDGEIDILESLGAPDSNAYHVHDATNPNGVGGDHNLSPVYGWHTFGCFWDLNQVTFYYDGALAGTVATDGFTGPHFIILVNTASGTPNPAPTTLQVDWVRVWTPGGGGGTVSGTGSLALGPIHLSGTNLGATGSGSIALSPLAFGNSFQGVPGIPVEAAGVISASADLNAWGNAANYLLGSSTVDSPVFYLMANTTQSLATSWTQVNFSSSGALFKDNAGGWSAGNPGAYVVKVAGYYHIEWSVSAATGAGFLECIAEVLTTSSNPYNPSAVIVFQHTNRAATTAVTVASNAGLVPVYLTPGDEIVLFAEVGTAVSTSSTFYPQLTGQWVSD